MLSVFVNVRTFYLGGRNRQDNREAQEVLAEAVALLERGGRPRGGETP
jgi:hypothetical protein